MTNKLHTLDRVGSPLVPHGPWLSPLIVRFARPLDPCPETRVEMEADSSYATPTNDFRSSAPTTVLRDSNCESRICDTRYSLPRGTGWV